MEEIRKLRVFLCHATEDKLRVRYLYRKFTSESWIDAWLDEENLVPGQKWEIEIPKAVSQADVVIIFLSAKSVNKEGYIQRELKYALKKALEKPDGTIFIIPLRLDDCRVPESIKELHWINFFRDNDEMAYERLKKALVTRAQSLGIHTRLDLDNAVQQTSTNNEQSDIVILAPDKALDYLNGVKVVNFDMFDGTFGAGWLFDIGKIKEGAIEIIGENWRGFSRTIGFIENQGFIVDFIYTKGSDMVMIMSNSTWNTVSHKQFGPRIIDDNQVKAQGWEGNHYFERGNLVGNLTLEPDKTFQLLMAILPNSEFLIAIWDPSDNSKAVFCREKFGDNWSTLTWKLGIQAGSGIARFSNYKEIIFDNAKSA